MTTRVMWFRRDLRLQDHPALNDAAADAEVVPLFVVDPKLLDDSVRTAVLTQALRNLDAAAGGSLVVRYGDPRVIVPAVASEVDAQSVHISADFAPYGRRRDAAVAEALGSIPLLATGSPYAIAPGRIRKGDGSPYRVYTPFYRAWLHHGWREPAVATSEPRWRAASSDGLTALSAHTATITLPVDGVIEVSETAAHRRWQEFRHTALSEYSAARDRPDLHGTSALSADLRFGTIHPRTLLADLDDSPGAEAFRREIAFREFYADVTFHNPTSTWQSLDGRFDTTLRYAEGAVADQALVAWQEGRTGFPFVDAGMRQLQAEGWIHNRVRMVVASFLVKDLHLPWQHGAAWFMRWLRDGDVASNAHGWQWTAGCGTDASPYHRIFNPVAQGKRFDPNGDYVRKYIPELRDIPGTAAHEPWLTPLLAPEYPAPIVDHAAARTEALSRFAEMKAHS